MEIAGDENGENAEGSVWNGSINGGQSTHHNKLASQMAAADGAEAVAEEVQGTSGDHESKQVTFYSSVFNTPSTEFPRYSKISFFIDDERE